jgi:hypothetical protein
MGSVFWKGGNQKVAKLPAIARLKMEDVCIFCNVIETFWQRKVTKVKKWRPSNPFKLQMALAQWCKNILACLYKQPNTWIAKGRNWSVGCHLWWLFALIWATLETSNPWIVQGRRSKFVQVGLAMTTLVRMRMPSLVSTMSTHRQKELNVVEESACDCSHPTWKPTFDTMVTKVSQIASWLPMCSLPWTQLKRWIPIGLMGCDFVFITIFKIMVAIWNTKMRDEMAP